MNREAPNDLGVSQRIAPVAVPAVMFRNCVAYAL